MTAGRDWTVISPVRPMSSDNPALELDTFLPYRLSVLANRLSRDLARLYAEKFDIAIADWRVMAVLGRHPGIAADDVCRLTEMDKVAVSRAIQRLRSKRMVNRKTDATDRRRSVLKLSAGGNRTYQRIVPLALRYERQLLAHLTAKTRGDLHDILGELDRATRQIISEVG